MLRRLGQFCTSSIGKKLVMSLTGLALVGFLIVHLAGNLLLWKSDQGAAFNGYAATLEGSPLLPLAEIGLAALFIGHIYFAFRTTIENREARGRGYAIRTSLGRRTVASYSMFVTGSIVLVFVILHLLDFRLRERAPDGLAAMVVRRLSQPAGAILYTVGVGALAIHLWHAVRSALQTLGIRHPRFQPLFERASIALAVALSIGFLSFPLVLFTSRGSGRSLAQRAGGPPANAEGHAESAATAPPAGGAPAQHADR